MHLTCSANHCNRCVSYGVLPEDEAIKANKAILKRKAKAKPGGSSSTTASSSAKKKVKKSKKIVGDVEFDAGLDAGGNEGYGVATL